MSYEKKLPPAKSHVDAMANKIGARIKHATGFASLDSVTLDCLACGNEIFQKLLVRKIKEKANANSLIDCRYCNMQAAIPAIQAYFQHQDIDKMSEKDANAKVITDHNVNPRSVWQSFRNDYRDDKLTPACRTLLETTFAGKLDKKKQGNKFSDEQLVSYLENLYREKPLSEVEKLQSEEHTIRRFRAQKADGTLLPEFEKRLIAVRVNLQPELSFSTAERLQQLKSFVMANNRLPRGKEFEDKRKAGDADGGLYDWQRDMYFKLRHGKLADEDLAGELIKIQKSLKS